MTIRQAQIKDADGIAKVHVDVWRSAYSGIIPKDFLDALSYEKRANERKLFSEKANPDYCTFVFTNNEDEVIGFSMGGPKRIGSEEYDGELYAIYLYDEFHGKGIGKSLFLAVKTWLKEKDHKKMMLWVLKDNPTRSFYEKMGGLHLGETTIEIGVPLQEVSYGWEL